VSYSDAEWVAYSWSLTPDTTAKGYEAGKKSRIERLRQKYASQ
jgi:hypothetical protein